LTSDYNPYTIDYKQAEIQREVNYHLVTPEDLQKRTLQGNGFLRNVLDGPKIFVIGNEETLRALTA